MSDMVQALVAAAGGTLAHGLMRAYMPAGIWRDVLPPAVKAGVGFWLTGKAGYKTAGWVLFGLAIADAAGLLVSNLMPAVIGPGAATTPAVTPTGQFVQIPPTPGNVWGFPKAVDFPLITPRLEQDPELFAYGYEVADSPNLIAERQAM